MGVLNFFARRVGNSPIKKIARGGMVRLGIDRYITVSVSIQNLVNLAIAHQQYSGQIQ